MTDTEVSSKYDLDSQYEEHFITEVSEGVYADNQEPFYSVKLDDGFGFGWVKTSIIPKIGDKIRLYGPGIGRPVRGVDINGQEIFYRTEEQQKIEDKKQAEKIADQQHLEYVLNEKKRQDQYQTFPLVFKQRIDDFRSRNKDFWKFEDYEFFCCGEALKIAKLGSMEAIEKFRQATTDQQKLLVPESDVDNHSGNTFGTSCLLARIYLENPSRIPQMHGALCPLVGCDEYKCYSTLKKDG